MHEDTRTEWIRKLQRLEEEHYILREGERLQDFTYLMLRHIGDPEPERIARVNGKHFVRSLYFRATARSDGHHLILNGAMLTAEAKLNCFNDVK